MPQVQFYPQIDLTLLQQRLEAFRCVNGLSHKQLGKSLEGTAQLLDIGKWKTLSNV